jgi:hypothetical protein
MAGGATCRSWDDFLTLAAQRWRSLRDELTSGRLSAHLQRIGRADLLPRPQSGTSPDEQLDAWLARLPVTRSSAPELDVHPESLVVRTALLGGTLKQTLRITNVGYRLLRSSARVESSAPGSIRLAPEFLDRPFITIDETELSLEIDLPEGSSASSLGTIVIESNGGSRRVDVRLERPAALPSVPAIATPVPGALDLNAVGRPLLARMAGLRLRRRLVFAPLGLGLFRLLIMLAGWIPLGAPQSSTAEPRLGAIALVLAATGLVLGAGRGARGGDHRDIAAAGFTGAVVGMFAAAVGYALVRSCESLLGGWAASPLAVLSLWAFLGVAIALFSWWAVPAPATRPAPLTPPTRNPELAP